ncbi:hypothetical protein [Kitasatospora purpeofusca]|uniref:hypothetical protein n=1 Tax=Kitasatospora purpeofusca TaxID=67352 RepID=UPI0036CA9FD4
MIDWIAHHLWYVPVYCFLWRNVCCNWIWSDLFLPVVRTLIDWGLPDELALAGACLLGIVVLGVAFALLGAGFDEEAAVVGLLFGGAVALVLTVVSALHIGSAEGGSTRTVQALAKNPVAARAYLAPNNTPDLETLRALVNGSNHPASLSGAGVRLRWHPGNRAVGELLAAAAGADLRTPHTQEGSTLAAAAVRAAHDAVGDDLPDGLRPAFGRIVRGYLNDVALALDETAPERLVPQPTPYVRARFEDAITPGVPQFHAAFDEQALRSVLTSLAADPAENEALFADDLLYVTLTVDRLLGVTRTNLANRSGEIARRLAGPVALIATLDSARTHADYKEAAKADKAEGVMAAGAVVLITEAVDAGAKAAGGHNAIGAAAQVLVHLGVELFRPGDRTPDEEVVDIAVRRSVEVRRTLSTAVVAAMWAGRAWETGNRPPQELLTASGGPRELMSLLQDEKLCAVFLKWLNNPARPSYLKAVHAAVAGSYTDAIVDYNRSTGQLS